MAQISTSETTNGSTENGAIVLNFLHGAETSACASDPHPVCTPHAAKLRPSADAKVGVYALAQTLSEQPRRYVTRSVARSYVTDGIAQWCNRGKAIKLTRARPQYAIRGWSAVMCAAVVERALDGSKRDQAIIAAWQPQTTGDQHAQEHPQTPSPHSAASAD